MINPLWNCKMHVAINLQHITLPTHIVNTLVHVDILTHITFINGETKKSSTFTDSLNEFNYLKDCVFTKVDKILQLFFLTSLIH